MLVELHINGKIELQLTPETAIERAFIATMHDAATKGMALKMSSSGADGVQYLISAETK